MPRIDFYLIPETVSTDKLRFTCRLLEKAYEQNHQVFICAETMAQAAQLNDLLWTFKDISFVPHHLAGTPGAITPPIQIGDGSTLPPHRDILINLHAEVPAFFDQFDRVIEMVLNEETSEKIKLDHTQFFQTKGFSVNTYDLRNKTSHHS